MIQILETGCRNSVAAKSESTLQYIVDEAVKHSIKWRYSFNLDKIRILVFRKNNRVRSVNITICVQGVLLNTPCQI